MKSPEEGYIKFNCRWIRAGPVPEGQITWINEWRNKLFDLGLIGADSKGTGFGNVSKRFKKNTFIITGSATGRLKRLNKDHYAMVNDYDLSGNSLTCSGPLKASSESLTHAAIYECSSDINAVFHVHSRELWEKLKGEVPTTSDEALYGTPEMAMEIKRLFERKQAGDEKIMVMGGHRDGIVSFGKTPDEAGEVLLNRL